MKPAVRLLALAGAMLAGLPIGSVQAEVRPVAMPGDTKLVNFIYDAKNTYTILARPMAITDIQLHEDEELVALALGDTAQWVTSEAPGHVFIKPMFPGLVTNGTLVTSKRTYQLTLRSSPEDGKFYAQVSWEHPDLVVLQAKQYQARRNAIEATRSAEEQRLAATVVTPGVSIEKLNFDYEVKGDADFKPKQVFDDGKFTWIRLPASQEMPALFMVSKDGQHELLNFTMRDQYMVIHRLVSKVLLKLGEEEVTVENRRTRKSFFSWGGDTHGN